MKELIKIQSELNCPKNQFNKFGNFAYRSQEDVLEALKPHLAANKCLLTMFDEVIMLGDRFYIKATCVFINSNGDKVISTGFAREPDDQKGMVASMLSGCASSYSRKYALSAMFLIDDQSQEIDSGILTPNKGVSKPSGGTFKKGGVNTPTKPQSSPKTPAKSSVGVPKPSPKPKPKLG